MKRNVGRNGHGQILYYCVLHMHGQVGKEY